MAIFLQQELMETKKFFLLPIKLNSVKVMRPSTHIICHLYCLTHQITAYKRQKLFL